MFRLNRLRYTALPVAAIGVVYATLSFFTPPQPPAMEKHAAVTPASPVHLAEALPPGITPAIVMQMTPAASPSLKSAFEENVAVKSKAPVVSETSDSVSAIRKSLSGIITAGNEFITSHKTLAVGRGDTLMNLLLRNHVPREQAYQAIAALTKIYDPRDLNPHHKITVFFHQDPAIADPQFSGLSIQKNVVSTVRVNRTDDGGYAVDQKDKTTHQEIKAFSGVIDGSLFGSAEAAGVPDSVILDLIKMYSWGVDFQREIQSGDKFEVMYKQPVTEDGHGVSGREEIVYAKLTLSDRALPFYRYKDSAGNVDFYDDKGQSAKKPLMKTPVDGARLASGFGMRTHPVLGYSKMHKGIDFAAPRGTPIYAAGNGIIEKMGPFSTYGNYVRILHQKGLETAYAHMQGFKAGLHAGSRVHQGQVIGYIGTTGRSTGPHLHYEILVNNVQANPMTVKVAGNNALNGRDLKSFQTLASNLNRTFRTLGRNSAVAENSGTQGTEDNTAN